MNFPLNSTKTAAKGAGEEAGAKSCDDDVVDAEVVDDKK